MATCDSFFGGQRQEQGLQELRLVESIRTLPPGTRARKRSNGPTCQSGAHFDDDLSVKLDENNRGAPRCAAIVRDELREVFGRSRTG